jgi:hypothetical protein
VDIDVKGQGSYREESHAVLELLKSDPLFGELLPAMIIDWPERDSESASLIEHACTELGPLAEDAVRDTKSGALIVVDRRPTASELMDAYPSVRVHVLGEDDVQRLLKSFGTSTPSSEEGREPEQHVPWDGATWHVVVRIESRQGERSINPNIPTDRAVLSGWRVPGHHPIEQGEYPVMKDVQEIPSNGMLPIVESFFRHIEGQRAR